MEGHEMCSNCRRDIPSANYRMHSLHCARNIALCPQCEEPIPRAEMEEHVQSTHAGVACQQCRVQIEACHMQQHQAETCAKRKLICKYCDIDKPADGMEEHENYCGSRTEKCNDCGERIMMKNWDIHMNSNHGFIKLNDEPGPKASWEKANEKKRPPPPAGFIGGRGNGPSVPDATPSTPSQRANFTATELFNNQDLYSSKRYNNPSSSSNGTSSISNGYSSSSTSGRRTSITSSSSSSMVNSLLNKSASSSVVAANPNAAANAHVNGQAKSSIVSKYASYSSESSKYASSSNDSSKYTSNSTESSKYGSSSNDLYKVTAKSLSTSKAITSKSEESDVMLPCEFCDSMIPMYKLLEHQADCVNPSNVRGPNSPSRRESVASPSYRPYSSASNASVSRSSSLNTGSSMVSKYLQQSSGSTPSETPPSTLSRYSNNQPTDLSNSSSTSKISPMATTSTTPLRKISPTYPSGATTSSIIQSTKPESIVNRYATPQSRPNGYSGYKSPEPTIKSPSPPQLEAVRPTPQIKRAQEAAQRMEAPGMYKNQDDRENLRQMLSGLRRDPMDVADDPDNNDGNFFPCEFCGDPYPCEFIMRHQMSCDLNPKPISSGDGFDYNQIQNSVARNLGIERTEVKRSSSSYQVPETEVKRSSSSYQVPETSNQVANQERGRGLSRTNSVQERSYSRTRRAESLSRTSSFADRSYGTRTALARQASFSVADYSAAARRSSVFDGYSGYAIYSSISQGLDQITYGGRTSRRNSVTESSFSLSRRGSFSSGNNYPLPALMAALEATKASQEEQKENRESANAHVNGQMHGQPEQLVNGQQMAFVVDTQGPANGAQSNGYASQNNGYSSKSNGYTSQSNGYTSQSNGNASQSNGYSSQSNGHVSQSFSRQNSQMESSPQQCDSPFGALPAERISPLEKSGSKILRRRSSLKHSASKTNLERKVSFHNGEQQVIGTDQAEQPPPDKPRRKKERTEEEKAERAEKKAQKKRDKSRDREAKRSEKSRRNSMQVAEGGHPTGGDLFDQVSSKLRDIEREQSSVCSDPPTPTTLSPIPSSSLFPDINAPPQKASNSNNNNASTDHCSSPNAPPEPPSHVTTTSNLTTTSSTSGHADVQTPDKQLTVNSEPTARPNKGPAPQPQSDINDSNEVTMTNGSDPPSVINSSDCVTLREQNQNSQSAGNRGASKAGSKRNSLDNKSVQSLAKDLAAECAKAYELMESSLSKLTTDFSGGPFGLAPRNKKAKKYRAPPAPTLNTS